ncbi:MAG: hypothetical protein KY464_04850 [Gemmatimonadetes bacterium]|nr:hypothetical protein [Gemmatimonadota bacterium]
MTEPTSAQEQAMCAMYRDGASLRTLEVAFDRPDEEIIRILHDNGVVQRNEGEGWEAFVGRVREDVKHETAA